MAQKIRKHWPLFQCLLGAETSTHARAFIRATSLNQMTTLIEIIKNVLYGVIPITEVYKKKLKKHKRIIQHLADTKRITSETRRVLIRHIGVVLLILQSVKGVIQSTL